MENTLKKPLPAERWLELFTAFVVETHMELSDTLLLDRHAKRELLPEVSALWDAGKTKDDKCTQFLGLAIEVEEIERDLATLSLLYVGAIVSVNAETLIGAFDWVSQSTHHWFNDRFLANRNYRAKWEASGLKIDDLLAAQCALEGKPESAAPVGLTKCTCGDCGQDYTAPPTHECKATEPRFRE